MISVTAIPSTGTATSSSEDSGTSWFSARMMPPTHMIGADAISVNVSSASIWTCCTSLVVRVISDGVPNLADLAGGELVHPAEQGPAHVPAERHRGAGAEVDRADRAGDLHQRDGEHHTAGAHDVRGVAGHHAVVDDVGVQRRAGTAWPGSAPAAAAPPGQYRAGTGAAVPSAIGLARESLQVPRGFPAAQGECRRYRTLYYRLAPQPRPAATEYRRPRTHIAQRDSAADREQAASAGPGLPSR